MLDDDPMPRDTLEEDELAAKLWYELVDSLVDEGHGVQAAIEIADALLEVRSGLRLDGLSFRLPRAAGEGVKVARSGWPTLATPTRSESSVPPSGRRRG